MNASTSSQSSFSPQSATVAAALQFVRTVGGLKAAHAALEEIASNDAAQRAQSKVELSVSDALRTVDSEEGRLRVLQEITSGPYPRYHAMPGVSDVLLRTESDGTQKLGKFVGREFREIG